MLQQKNQLLGDTSPPRASPSPADVWLARCKNENVCEFSSVTKQ